MIHNKLLLKITCDIQFCIDVLDLLMTQNKEFQQRISEYRFIPRIHDPGRRQANNPLLDNRADPKQRVSRPITI